MTNDPLSLPGLDGRSVSGRRYRDLLEALIDEFGPSVGLVHLRELAALRFTLEREQGAIVNGDQRSLEDLVRLTNTIERKERALRLRARRTAATAAPAPGSGLRDRLAAKYREAGP